MARIALLLATSALAASTAGSAGARVGAVPFCPPQPVSPGYAAAVNAALASRQDVWGDALLHSSGGPATTRFAATCIR